MSICTKCGTEFDGAFCPSCGTPAQSTQQQTQQQYQQTQQQQYQTPPFTAPMPFPDDHTAEFDARDIAENKLIATCAYLSIIGIVVAALINNRSPFVMFHIREALKLAILQFIVGLFSILIITLPLVGIAEIVLTVISIIGMVNAIQGKAKLLPIVSKIGFLN